MREDLQHDPYEPIHDPAVCSRSPAHEDMLSCVVTMHPRATKAIGSIRRLADLRVYDQDQAENCNRVVVLKRLATVANNLR